jgi:quercetin dioxygenase-like cupin family protein
MKRPPKKKQLEALDAAALTALTEAIRPAELSQSQRSSMRRKIAARIAPEQPVNTETVRAEAVQWQAVWPNVWVKMLRLEATSNLQMVLFKIRPGGVVPAHVHTKEEECLVLEGEIFIGTHRVGEGDLHIAHSGAAHGDITTRTGATVLVRSEIPPKYLRALLAGNE